MTKLTLDMNTFKALASDTRLDILKALDGKKLSLKDISRITNLNKATLHEHLTKLNEAGLVKKKEREGHKWVYYKLHGRVKDYFIQRILGLSLCLVLHLSLYWLLLFLWLVFYNQ